MKALLDTSVLVEIEAGRGIGIEDLPDESAISVVTLAELRLGVLLAADADSHAMRLASLGFAERHFEPLPIDSEVAHWYARIEAQVTTDGRAIGCRTLGSRPPRCDTRRACSPTTVTSRRSILSSS